MGLGVGRREASWSAVAGGNRADTALATDQRASPHTVRNLAAKRRKRLKNSRLLSFLRFFAAIPFVLEAARAILDLGSPPSELVGKIGVGRATIQVLNINHPEAVALRQALKEEGLLCLAGLELF